jgi:anti-sigma regulatory factor (Ser/Thr protein kinase)
VARFVVNEMPGRTRERATTTDAGWVRPVKPPYLLHAAPEVAVVGDESTAVVEMTARGAWSRRLGDRVATGLSLCLAGPSDSIIVDLRDLDDPHGASMPFWLAAWRQARLAPSPVRLALSLPASAALSRRLRALDGPQPRVFTTVPDARVALTERMPRADRLQIRLSPRPDSVRAARDLVAQACAAWELPHLLGDAVLITSELAANAVEHAATEYTVTLSRGDQLLHVTVHDELARFPRPRLAAGDQDDPLAERGRGLPLVHGLAAAWGAMPAYGGQVVWATVR